MAQPLIPRAAKRPRTPKAPPAPKPLPAKGYIDKPGVYRDIEADRYHQQLTSTPSLSAGMAHTLERTCAAKMFHESYLNPGYVPETGKHFDIGSAAHLIVLEPEHLHTRIWEVKAKSYQSERAQVQREHGRAMGRIPLLTHQLQQVTAIRDRLLAHPMTRNAFVGGRAEQTVVARDPAKGVWLKVRPDYADDAWQDVVDLKTTFSVHPEALKRKAYDDGWFMRAAFYLDVIEAATGRRPGKYWFVCVEVDPPHLINLVRFTDRALEWGRMANRHAIDTFAKCLTDDVWPDYASEPTVIDLPNYAEWQLEDRRQSGGFAVKPSPAQLAAAMKFQAPIGRG